MRFFTRVVCRTHLQIASTTTDFLTLPKISVNCKLAKIPIGKVRIMWVPKRKIRNPQGSEFKRKLIPGYNQLSREIVFLHKALLRVLVCHYNRNFVYHGWLHTRDFLALPQYFPHLSSGIPNSSLQQRN